MGQRLEWISDLLCVKFSKDRLIYVLIYQECLEMDRNNDNCGPFKTYGFLIHRHLLGQKASFLHSSMWNLIAICSMDTYVGFSTLIFFWSILHQTYVTNLTGKIEL